MGVVCKCLLMKSKSLNEVTFLLHSLLPVLIFAYVCARAHTNAHANTQMAFCTMVQPSAPMCQSHLIRVQSDSSARLYQSKRVCGG